MKTTRKMEPAWLKVSGGYFPWLNIETKDQFRPCYSLTKMECLYIATKFNDEARAKLVLRWEELECERSKVKEMAQDVFTSYVISSLMYCS